MGRAPLLLSLVVVIVAGMDSVAAIFLLSIGLGVLATRAPVLSPSGRTSQCSPPSACSCRCAPRESSCWPAAGLRNPSHSGARTGAGIGCSCSSRYPPGRLLPRRVHDRFLLAAFAGRGTWSRRLGQITLAALPSACRVRLRAAHELRGVAVPLAWGAVLLAPRWRDRDARAPLAGRSWRCSPSRWRDRHEAASARLLLGPEVRVGRRGGIPVRSRGGTPPVLRRITPPSPSCASPPSACCASCARSGAHPARGRRIPITAQPRGSDRPVKRLALSVGSAFAGAAGAGFSSTSGAPRRPSSLELSFQAATFPPWGERGTIVVPRRRLVLHLLFQGLSSPRRGSALAAGPCCSPCVLPGGRRDRAGPGFAARRGRKGAAPRRAGTEREGAP